MTGQKVVRSVYRVQPRRPRAVWLFLFALAALGLVAWWSNDNLTGLGRLKHNPAASLTYPGSVLIRQGGHQGERGIDGQTSATATRQLGSLDGLEPILAFYRDRLTSDGWATGGGSSVFGAGFERQICAWHKDGVVVRLSFWKPDKWAEMHPKDVQYPIVYEFELIETTNPWNGLACSNKDL